MADDFESEYMSGGAKVLHRDKRVSRGMAAILGIWAPLLWGLAGYLAFANASADRPVPDVALPFVVGAIALLGVLFGALALSFAVLRTVVTENELLVKYGLWGPEISLAAIESVKVIDYDVMQFGGWGIRRGLGGKWAYVPGPGEVVEVVYQDGERTQTVQIGADDARELMVAINRARQALGSRVRVAVETDGQGLEEEELEEHEVEAESGGEERESKRG